ncbi:MAG: PD-(D/E)XK nuclease family protein [Alphaproteobacteria bacterium]
MTLENGLYTIPASDPFLEVLADTLLKETQGNPLALSDVVIFLQTAAARTAITKIFLEKSPQKVSILPKLYTLGNLDEEEMFFQENTASAHINLPAIGGVARQLLLVKSLQEENPSLRFMQATQIAGELLSFLDQAQNEQLDLAAIPSLVADEQFSEHWEKNLRYLSVLSGKYQDDLKAMQRLNPKERNNLLLAQQAKIWAENPPAHPVIIAGSTGTNPATLSLIETVVNLPQGVVLLAGLDKEMPAEIWDNLDETHPQYALALLLKKVKKGRGAVSIWQGTGGENEDRRSFWLGQMMQPVMNFQNKARMQDDIENAFQNFTLTACKNFEEEAHVIALRLRHFMAEKPAHEKAILITPDRDLAARVKGILKRWEMPVDDFFTVPLSETAGGAFALLTADFLSNTFAASRLLSLLKNPMTQADIDLERLEKNALRPAYGKVFYRDLAALVTETGDEYLGKIVPFITAFNTARDMESCFKAHIRFIEFLAGGEAFWGTDEGARLSTFFRDILSHVTQFPRNACHDYMDILSHFLNSKSQKNTDQIGARIQMMQPLEARLMRADLMILGGLNEGTWPSLSDDNPWLSAQMRKAFGLLTLERRVGLAAHDFIQFIAHQKGEIMLTHAARIGGRPTVTSRWIVRLKALFFVDPETTEKAPFYENNTYKNLFYQLDGCEKVTPQEPPLFAPPLHARPKRFTATEIEDLFENPYKIYAKKILDLRPLGELDADLEASDKGNIIHNILEKFVEGYGAGKVTEDKISRARLMDVARTEFQNLDESQDQKIFWWAQFEDIADWFLKEENARLHKLDRSYPELKGTSLFVHDVELHARADRLDRLADGTVQIIDYKTGAVPSKKDISSLKKPQLTVAAMILEDGGFREFQEAKSSALSYWGLRDGKGNGVVEITENVSDIVAEMCEKLAEELEKYTKQGATYPAHPDGVKDESKQRFVDPYDHLARVKEWS